MLWIGIIAAVTTFLFFKNKQENRMIDRRNRLLEKQDEIIESLKEKNESKNSDDEN